VDTGAIALKVKQEFAGREKTRNSVAAEAKPKRKKAA
jgi:hypothetical protein